MGAVAEMLRSGDWGVPMLAGQPYLDRAPLFFWTAAAFAKVFGAWLPLHDAARLASGFLHDPHHGRSPPCGGGTARPACRPDRGAPAHRMPGASHPRPRDEHGSRGVRGRVDRHRRTGDGREPAMGRRRPSRLGACHRVSRRRPDARASRRRARRATAPCRASLALQALCDRGGARAGDRPAARSRVAPAPRAALLRALRGVARRSARHPLVHWLLAGRACGLLLFREDPALVRVAGASTRLVDALALAQVARRPHRLAPAAGSCRPVLRAAFPPCRGKGSSMPCRSSCRWCCLAWRNSIRCRAAQRARSTGSV